MLTWHWQAYTADTYREGTLTAADYWGAMTAAMSHPEIPNGTIEFTLWL